MTKNSPPAFVPADDTAKKKYKLFVVTDADRKNVEKLSGLGVPLDQIASMVHGGMDPLAMAKRFAKEIAKGRAKANSAVAERLWKKAVDGDTAAMIWWTKSRMGWRDGGDAADSNDYRKHSPTVIQVMFVAPSNDPTQTIRSIELHPASASRKTVG